MTSLTETLLALVPTYGAGLLGLITFLACLAVPVPASLAMLTAGAFAATGDLSLGAVLGAAYAGAVLGDQVGYGVGRRASGGLRRLSAAPARQKLLNRAQTRLHESAGLAVFLSRWLFSPLGPWVNFAAGAMAVGWAPFTLGSVTGEGVWVALYVGLGWGFATQIDRIGAMVGNLGGLALALGAATLILALLRRRRRRPAP